MISDREGQPHRLVIGIAQADREARIAVLVIQIERAEHLHAVGRDGVFVANDMDMPESERFDQRLDHLNAESACAPWPAAPESSAIHREKFWLCRNGQ